MATNERENARKEKQRNKDRRAKRIAWSVIIVVFVALLVMKICEIDFDAIKNRYTDKDGKFTVSMTTDEDAYPYQLDSSNNVYIHSVNDKLSVLTNSSLNVLNPTNAKALYSFDHGYANPMVCYAQNYICLFDQGGTRLRLDTNNDNLYESTMQKPILTADVAPNGNVIYAIQSDNAKSELVVNTRSLKNLLDIDINDGYVVSVAIDQSGKKCAYATVNSENAVLKTTVHTLNIDSNNNEDIATFVFEGTNILDMKYKSSNLYVIGDNAVSVISSQKSQKQVFKSGTISVINYAYTASDELIVDYTEYDGANENIVAYVRSNGKVKTSIKLDKRIKDVSASSKEIMVLYSDKIETYSITKGVLKSSFACDDSYKSTHPISSKTFVQRGQMLDVLD